MVRNASFSNIQGTGLYIIDVWGDTSLDSVQFLNGSRAAEVLSKYIFNSSIRLCRALMNRCNFRYHDVDVRNDVLVSYSSFSNIDDIDGMALFVEDVGGGAILNSVNFKDLHGKGAKIMSKWKSHVSCIADVPLSKQIFCELLS